MLRTSDSMIACVLLVVVSTVAASQRTEARAAQTVAAQKLGDHHEVSIVAVRAATEWRFVPGMAAFLEAKAGEMLVVVEFAVKDVRSGNTDAELLITSSEFELEDAAGKKFKCPLATTHQSEYLIVAPPNYRIRQIPFAVPEATVVRWVRIRGLRFDLQSFNSALKSP